MDQLGTVRYLADHLAERVLAVFDKAELHIPPDRRGRRIVHRRLMGAVPPVLYDYTCSL